MRKLLSFILIAAFSLSIPIYGYAQTPFHEDSEAIALAAESVLLLSCYDEYGDEVATGSGFLAIDNGIILTNYHVIEDVTDILATTEDGIFFTIDEILCYDETIDVAILKTKAKTRLPLLTLGDSDSIKKGARIVAIGSPLGILNIVSEGIYSGIYNDEGVDQILFSASISSGSSGGALFNDSGEVIGITAATYTEGQNLNLAVPINDVLSLWNQYQAGEWNESPTQSIPSSPASRPSGTEDYYTVRLNPKGGYMGTASVKAVYSGPMPPASAPRRSGYIFQGYYASENGTGTKYYDADMNSIHVWDRSSNGVLYAYWTKEDADSGTGFTSDGAYYVVGSSPATFRVLHGKMCVNLDLKKHPIPAPDITGSPFADGEYEKYSVICDGDTYETIGYVYSPSGTREYIIRYWGGLHKTGQEIGMEVYYETDGTYLGNIQYDYTNEQSTSSSNSPYYISSQPNHHLE